MLISFILILTYFPEAKQICKTLRHYDKLLIISDIQEYD